MVLEGQGELLGRVWGFRFIRLWDWLFGAELPLLFMLIPVLVVLVVTQVSAIRSKAIDPLLQLVKMHINTLLLIFIVILSMILLFNLSV